MKKIPLAGLLWAALLVACGGSGGGGPPPGNNNPPPNLPPVVFRNVTGTTPADAALGQPLAVDWDLPAGVSIAAVSLEASAIAGTGGNQVTCAVNAGALASTATSATITIPNTCQTRTVREVQLRVIVDSSSGQRTTATHNFSTPGDASAFVPVRRTLPILHINTDNAAPIVSKDVYIPAQMVVDPNVTGGQQVTSGLQIRGRGNSTWGMPKKPYRLRLTSGLPLLGMPSSRDWVLLANYSDKTLMRNALALELGARVGMPWTSRSVFVEVYVNNRYDGVYLLTENIKVDEDRVNIDELDEDDVAPELVTGGYLLEVDFRQDGHTIFSAIDQLPIVFQDPEEPAPAQEAYLQGYLDQFETVLYSAGFADPVTGYAAYIDVDSFIRWFIVNEVFRNRDANMWSSCWMYKPRDGRLHMGPLWDFDIAAGNIDYDAAFQTSGWWVRDAPWFSRLFEDPAFAARARQMWNEVMADDLPQMMQSIPVKAAQLQQPQLNNFQRWPILETYVWPNNRIPGSYEGEVDYLQDWLTARIAWMDAQFNP